MHTHSQTNTHTHAHTLTNKHTHTHMHTHSQTNTHTHMHTHSQTNTHTHAHTLTNKHTHTHAHTLTNKHTHTHTHAHTLTNKHTHTCTHTHKQTHTHTRTCTHTHKQTYTCTYSQTMNTLVNKQRKNKEKYERYQLEICIQQTLHNLLNLCKNPLFFLRTFSYLYNHFYSLYTDLEILTMHIRGGCPRGVMVKAMECGIVVSEFVLQSRYYIHFRANTHWERYEPPYPSQLWVK